MNRAEIKICGITSPGDARLCAANGVDMLGLIFCDSPRRVSMEQARGILSGLSGISSCGVFRNMDMAEVAAIANELRFDCIQLHEAASSSSLQALLGLCNASIRVVVEPGQLDDDQYMRMLAGSGIDSLLLDLPKRGSGQPILTIQQIGRASAYGLPVHIAGGLNPYSAASLLRMSSAAGVDVASGVESAPGRKQPRLLEAFVSAVRSAKEGLPRPALDGRMGPFGGAYVPETLIPALEELDSAYRALAADSDFQRDLAGLLRDYAGRETPLYLARRLSEQYGRPIYLKREDLLHTGAHKLNNCIGQALLARRLGRRHVIAETGAGQHGVAVATTAAMLGLGCRVYMGSEDMRRQGPNVRRMELLGAEVRPVESGSRTLKDATSEAIRDWVASCRDSHYLIGSAVGPHPYPAMVRDFQAVIGNEARRQCLEQCGSLPQDVVASVGGGSNAIGIFAAFLADTGVKLLGAEAGGHGSQPGQHAAAIGRGRPGVLHGSLSYLLQDDNGQVEPVHSISAGLDYPGVGPEHSFLAAVGRVSYESVTDVEALAAFHLLCRTEGIIPALESSHALALALRRSGDGPVLVCLSGRGDKDVEHVLATQRLRGEGSHEAA